MQKKLSAKLAIIAGLCLTLLIPLWMIESQILSRSQRQETVINDIAEMSAGSQTLVGPVIVVRYSERVARVSKDKDTGTERTLFETVERKQVLPAQNLSISGSAEVESRSRGIYSANLYHISARVSGKLEIPPNLGKRGTLYLVDQPQAYLMMGLSDLRGVGNDPEVLINGKPHRFATDTEASLSGKALTVALGSVDIDQKAAYRFEFPLQLTGTGYFEVAPTANETSFELKSAWPHPSFQGRFLPQQREIGKDGFSANWGVSHLARNFEQTLRGHDTMKISFIEPVNIYLKAERAVKYGLIFIVLTFSAFFLLEVIRHSPIHPLQYLMVGLALAIFFLLLIALSEHIPFALAYGVSAAGCIGLISVYLGGVLKNARSGLIFGAGLAVLYGILYGVLLSEDSALLMGALLLFASLGTIMFLTRHINWYQIVDHLEKPIPESR